MNEALCPRCKTLIVWPKGDPSPWQCSDKRCQALFKPYSEETPPIGVLKEQSDSKEQAHSKERTNSCTIKS